MNELNPMDSPAFDATPGRNGDIAKVIPMIVVDTSTERKFYTTDGVFLGVYRQPAQSPTSVTSFLDSASAEAARRAGNRSANPANETAAAEAFKSIAEDYRKFRIMEETRFRSQGIPQYYGSIVLDAAYEHGTGVCAEDVIRAGNRSADPENETPIQKGK